MNVKVVFVFHFLYLKYDAGFKCFKCTWVFRLYILERLKVHEHCRLHFCPRVKILIHAVLFSSVCISDDNVRKKNVRLMSLCRRSHRHRCVVTRLYRLPVCRLNRQFHIYTVTIYIAHCLYPRFPTFELARQILHRRCVKVRQVF